MKSIAELKQAIQVAETSEDLAKIIDGPLTTFMKKAGKEWHLWGESDRIATESLMEALEERKCLLGLKDTVNSVRSNNSCEQGLSDPQLALLYKSSHEFGAKANSKSRKGSLWGCLFRCFRRDGNPDEERALLSQPKK